MNPKFKLIFFVAPVVFIATSCHFGFPDCKDDSNLSVLKRAISEKTQTNYDKLEIFDIEETGLDDDGFGANFICECKAKYRGDRITGSINFSVTRKNSNYSTRILNSNTRSFGKVLREGEQDSLTSINRSYFKRNIDKPEESLFFKKNRPAVGQEHTLFVNGEYSKYSLSSITPLYQRREIQSFDSTSIIDEYDFSELLFEFGGNDKICLYAAKFDNDSFKYFDNYSYKINQVITIDKDDNMQKSIQFLECTILPSFDRKYYFVLFKNTSTSAADSTVEDRIWELDLAYNEKNRGYYRLYGKNPKSIQKKCWEEWE
jgi:hypothetical protein